MGRDTIADSDIDTNEEEDEEEEEEESKTTSCSGHLSLGSTTETRSTLMQPVLVVCQP